MTNHCFLTEQFLFCITVIPVMLSKAFLEMCILSGLGKYGLSKVSNA